MFIIFFLLWLVFNERVTLEVVYFGLGISAALYLFIVKFMDYSPKKEWAAIKKIPGVNDASVNFLSQKLVLDADDARFDEILKDAIAACKKVDSCVEVVVK